MYVCPYLLCIQGFSLQKFRLKICFHAFDTHIETTVSTIMHRNSCGLAPVNQSTQKFVRTFNSVEDALSIVVNLLLLQVIIMTGDLHHARSYGEGVKHVFCHLVQLLTTVSLPKSISFFLCVVVVKFVEFLQPIAI